MTSPPENNKSTTEFESPLEPGKVIIHTLSLAAFARVLFFREYDKYIRRVRRSKKKERIST